MTAPIRQTRHQERSTFIQRAERAKSLGATAHRLAADAAAVTIYVLHTPTRAQLLADLQALDAAIADLEAAR